MPEYKYSAITPDGVEIEGRKKAESLEQLKRIIENKGMKLLYSKEVFSFPIKLKRKKLHRRRIIDLLIQVETQYKAGLPILEVFKSLAEDEHDPELRQIIENISDDLASGVSLSDSLYSNEIIDGMGRYILHAGEESGSLDRSFDILVHHYEWVDELRGIIKQASIYPIVLIVALILFVVIIFGFVVPKIANLLVQLHAEIPLPTKILLWLSSFIQHHWFGILATLIAVPIGVFFARKMSKEFAYKFDKGKLRVPIFGELFLMISLSRVVHVLKNMFSSGIPVTDTMDIAAGSCGNVVINRILMNSKRIVEQGESISDALKKCGENILPSMFLRLIAAGEESGHIEETLSYIAQHYDKVLPRRTKMAISALEPAILIILGIIVGLTALSIIMPIMNIIDSF